MHCDKTLDYFLVVFPLLLARVVVAVRINFRRKILQSDCHACSLDSLNRYLFARDRVLDHDDSLILPILLLHHYVGRCRVP